MEQQDPVSIADKLKGEALTKDVQDIPNPSTLSAEAENQENLIKIANTNPQNYNELMQFKRFKIQQKNEKSERNLRKKNAKLAFIFSSAWAAFIALVILLHGFGQQFKFFSLSQTEFLFIIGSLTASIFAFYSLVLRYLFYRKETSGTNAQSQSAVKPGMSGMPAIPANPTNNTIG